MRYLATAARGGSGEASADVRLAIVTVPGRARTRGHRALGEDDPGAPPQKSSGEALANAPPDARLELGRVTR